MNLLQRTKQWFKDKWARAKRWIFGLIATPALAVSGLAVADNVQDKYVEFDNRYEYVMEQQLKDAGDARVVLYKDEPKVELRKWNGEADMAVKYTNVQAQGSRQFLTQRVEWQKQDEEVHAYPLAPKEGMEDGGFEIEVVLDKAPASNEFKFQIEGYEDLNFFYQPPLTQEEIAEGSERPENVVGSYAVYHTTRANHKVGETNYATGKAYHIYRPKAVDADGNEQWAELFYNEGVLTVTVPQKFLDEAVYPVVVDPTFGYTSVGGSSIGTTSNQIYGTNKTTLGENGDVTELVMYTRSNPAPVIKLIIWADSSNYPGTREVLSPEVAIDSTPQWQTGNISPSESLSSGSYWFGFISSGTTSYYYDSGGTRYGKTGDSYTSPSTTYPASGTSASRTVSIYGTYTTGGGGAEPEHYISQPIIYE